MTIDVDATYENGVLKLDRPVGLADKTRVHVTIEAPSPAATSDWKTVDELIGSIDGGPEDGAANHDKYLYGFTK
jgi:predicted DNA-binding antitoxin AbrB/MazE fold protein